MLLVLKLGFLGGIFGALLRSLNDFVGTVCYKGNFSLQKYWPLHVTRPFVGAILGAFTIILFNAGFLSSSGTPPASSAWWSIAVAFLAGFSTLDVTERLRSTAKALFGSAPSESSRTVSVNNQGTNQNTTVINQRAAAAPPPPPRGNAS